MTWTTSGFPRAMFLMIKIEKKLISFTSPSFPPSRHAPRSLSFSANSPFPLWSEKRNNKTMSDLFQLNIFLKIFKVYDIRCEDSGVACTFNALFLFEILFAILSKSKLYQTVYAWPSQRH